MDEATVKPNAEPIIWWKDKKLIVGAVLIIVSLIAGLIGKGIIFARIYDPSYRKIGVVTWALSWIPLFIGVLLLGIETIKIIKQQIEQSIRKTVKYTYLYSKNLPRKGIAYTKELHKKGISKLNNASRLIKKNKHVIKIRKY